MAAVARRIRLRAFSTAPQMSAARHRPFRKEDALRLRNVGTGLNVRAKGNPGVRVEPAFVSEEEEAALAVEARGMVDAYGYNYQGDTETVWVDEQGRHGGTSRRVNNARVTGRYERPEQRCAPWGYGSDLREEALPEHMRRVAARLRASPSFAFGALRDVTINRRLDGFFRLDPHVDPSGDGDSVVIVNLLSDVVLTFTPAQAPEGVARRTSMAEVCQRSWTDADVDCLLQRRAAVHFTGPARHTWMHAIRSGLLVQVEGGEDIVCDWWGQSDYLIRREPERISIVFAFE